MELNGKVVIVTGASEGIGLATARLFTARGAKVALAARSAEKLQDIVRELPDALAVPTDMRDEAAIHNLVSHVHRHYGCIDVLVNNAGQGFHVPIEQMNLQQYRELFELNVVGVLAAMQSVIPLMRQQGGGMIINISSGTSKMILPGVGPYASTKYTLNALTLTARLELAPDNIRVGLVYPGITATSFAKNAVSMQHTAQRPPAMMVEQPEQVAEKILEAVRTEEAETYADSLKKLGADRS